MKKPKLSDISKEMRELTEMDLTYDRKVVPLKLLTGGMDGRGFWLLDMNIADVFLARPKPNNAQPRRTFELNEYGIFNRTEKSVLLLVVQPGASSVPVWVDGREFSNAVEHFETLRSKDERILRAREEIERQKQEEKAYFDGNDLRPLQSGRLETDEGHQV